MRGHRVQVEPGIGPVAVHGVLGQAQLAELVHTAMVARDTDNNGPEAVRHMMKAPGADTIRGPSACLLRWGQTASTTGVGAASAFPAESPSGFCGPPLSG